MFNIKEERSFYGVTTIGEKGQAVIPVDARKRMTMKKGEKLLVFGMGKDMLVLAKLANMEKIFAHIASNLKNIQKIQKAIKNK